MVDEEGFEGRVGRIGGGCTRGDHRVSQLHATGDSSECIPRVIHFETNRNGTKKKTNPQVWAPGCFCRMRSNTAGSAGRPDRKRETAKEKHQMDT